jgi:hypothetical protein
MEGAHCVTNNQQSGASAQSSATGFQKLGVLFSWLYDRAWQLFQPLLQALISASLAAF